MSYRLFHRATAVAMLTVLTLGTLALGQTLAPSFATGTDGLAAHVPDRLIVKFQPQVNEKARLAFYDKLQARRVDTLNYIKADVVVFPRSKSLKQWKDILSNNPLVYYATPDYLVSGVVNYFNPFSGYVYSSPPATVTPPRTSPPPASSPPVSSPPVSSGGGGNNSGVSMPNDSNFSLQWGMYNSGGSDIKAAQAWSQYSPQSSVIVGVVDSGVDYTHSDLAPNMWVNPGEDLDKDGVVTSRDRNGRDDDGDGLVDNFYGADYANNDGDPMDDYRHGTHVAGIIAARFNNGYGVAGVAGQGRVRIMALKFLDSRNNGSTSNAIKAIDFASRKGVKILNNSWGGGSYNQALLNAINNFQARGGLFIAAAGNSSRNTDSSPFYPASYTPSSIISVASIAQGDSLSTFSNFGATSVDVAAPGTSIYSTLPNQGFGYMSGTSMACPHVAGLAAMIWSQNPNLSAAQVKSIILSSARRVSGLQGRMTTPAVINAREALRQVTGR